MRQVDGCEAVKGPLLAHGNQHDQLRFQRVFSVRKKRKLSAHGSFLWCFSWHCGCQAKEHRQQMSVAFCGTFKGPGHRKCDKSMPSAGIHTKWNLRILCPAILINFMSEWRSGSSSDLLGIFWNWLGPPCDCESLSAWMSCLPITYLQPHRGKSLTWRFGFIFSSMHGMEFTRLQFKRQDLRTSSQLSRP